MTKESLDERKKKLIFTEEEAEELIGDLKKNMKSDEEYSVEDFSRHFANRRAEYPLSTYGIVGIGAFIDDVVDYDINLQFDVRGLINILQSKKDKELMRDVCIHVGERFVNCEPCGDLSLKQYRTILTSRLIAVGF